MTDPVTMMAAGSFAIAGLCLTSAAGLRAWRGWLDLKRLELAEAERRGEPRPPSPAAARIELADLKERVRRLEAIALGIDP
ncbi:hypothetical protein [Allosphingosinicella humi]|jgi:hypothetical protein